MVLVLMIFTCVGGAFANDASNIAPMVAQKGLKTNNIEPVTQEPKDVEKYHVIVGGYTYECPYQCNWVTPLTNPPACESSNPDRDCTVRRYVSSLPTNQNSQNTNVQAVSLTVDRVDVTPGVVSPNAVVSSKVDVPVKAQRKPDVSRAAKVKPMANAKPTPVPDAKMADGEVTIINCPANCPVPNCWVLGNVIMCQCKVSDAPDAVACKPDSIESLESNSLK
jgi:hypothetical protein